MVFGKDQIAGLWNKGLTKENDKRLDYIRPTQWKKGYHPKTEFKKGHKNSEAHIKIMREKWLGNKNPNWNNGSSLKGYLPEFNKQFKSKILSRDMFKCQIKNKKHHKLLDIHHIDYNKKNNDEDNLIVLCKSCHMKTNYNRDCWQDYFKNKI